MKSICIIGANGFVGKALCRQLQKMPQYKLIKITRKDNMKKLIQQSDLIIHSANSSKRYFANQNREEDLFDTLEKMLKIISYANQKKIILISTISARVQLQTSYGRHRRACELLLDEKKDLIIRMANMFGQGNAKGALSDIVNNRIVYADKKTKCAFVDVKYNAAKVVDLIDKVGIIELGAKNFIELGEIAKQIGSTSTFQGSLDTQLPEISQPDAPDIKKVFDFIKNNLLMEKK
jgi:nucleoside-diphosphate-sugar epimerase